MGINKPNKPNPTNPINKPRTMQVVKSGFYRWLIKRLINKFDKNNDTKITIEIDEYGNFTVF